MPLSENEWAILRQRIQDALGGGVAVNLPTEFDELKAALLAALEASIDTGVATGGSNTTIVDAAKSWAANMWIGATFEVSIAGVQYLGIVTSNTANTITIPALAGGAIVVAGSAYALKRPVTLADISDRAARLLGVVQSLTQWGGTALTGRNISADLQALTDDSIKGLLKSIGDIAALENIITRIGQTSDAIVAAGAVGSISAKLRRVTQGLEDLKTVITLAELPDALSAGGNLKVSGQEATIAWPTDIQARYNVKSTRDIAAPAINTDYYLPETGNIDLSNFKEATFFIYVTTNKPDIIRVEASLDGGTTWYPLEGYTIAVADFVLATWNTIHVPLCLAETRLLVSTDANAPGAISMACIRKA